MQILNIPEIWSLKFPGL